MPILFTPLGARLLYPTIKLRAHFLLLKALNNR